MNGTQLDPELLLAKFKQSDYERQALRSRQAREAKTNQSSWFTRPGSLNRNKASKNDAKWDHK
jgi:hypothetical protein